MIKIMSIKEPDKITLHNKPANLSDALEKVINNVIDRVEKEVKDKDYFRSFAENFEKGTKTNLYAKNIALFVERDEERKGRAFLGVSVLHPTMSIDATNYFMNGNWQEIVDFLKNPEFKNTLEDKIVALSESLKNR